MNDLRGKVALVTGSGTRVGAAIARRLGALGMRVAVHHRASASGAAEVCAAIAASGGEARPFSADLADLDAARDLVDRVRAHFGALDLLVPSAAVCRGCSDRSRGRRPLRADDAHQLREPHRDGAARAGGPEGRVRRVHHLHQRDASLPRLSAVRGLEGRPPPGDAEPSRSSSRPTCASTRSLRARCCRRSISTWRRSGRCRSSIPLAQFGVPADVADAVVYLATATFVTGHELVVDGGRVVETTL